MTKALVTTAVASYKVLARLYGRNRKENAMIADILSHCAGRHMIHRQLNNISIEQR